MCAFRDASQYSCLLTTTQLEESGASGPYVVRQGATLTSEWWKKWHVSIRKEYQAVQDPTGAPFLWASEQEAAKLQFQLSLILENVPWSRPRLHKEEIKVCCVTSWGSESFIILQHDLDWPTGTLICQHISYLCVCISFVF